MQKKICLGLIFALLIMFVGNASVFATGVISFDVLQLNAGAGKVQYEFPIGEDIGWTTELYIRAEDLGKSWATLGIETGPKFYKQTNLEGFWCGINAGIRMYSDQSPILSGGVGVGYRLCLPISITIEPAAWFTLRSQGVTGFFPKLGIGYRF